MNDILTTPNMVLDYWFGLEEQRYWVADHDFDAELTARFGTALKAAKVGDYDDWGGQPHGALALIVLLDQMSRNIYRASAQMYEGDAKALTIVKASIARGFDKDFPSEQRRWFYLPFMHSETLADQVECLRYFRQFGPQSSIESAIEHHDIIAQYGRFPHRNAILKRATTKQEQAFLDAGGFAG